MAKHGISRTRSGGQPELRTPPPHDAWKAELLTGVLDLRLRTLADRFVSPGTGRLSLMPSPSGGDIVAHEAARAAGVPVIPGSGIKGAVRTLYEILSDACDPHLRQSPCRQSLRQRDFEARGYCEACSLFGCMGWHGRLSFSDAAPAEPDAVDAGVHWVPTPWEPDASKTPGDFRLYDLGAAVVVDQSTGQRSEAERDLAREGYEGVFETRLNFWNVEEQELGRLLLAMGVAEDDAARFPIRLGGCKYDGQGAVEVEPVAGRLVTPERQELNGTPLRDRWSGWLRAALAAQWGKTYGSKLDELAGISRRGA